ncbi:MAG: hypothetical protein K1X72_06165 [Pyrinomonadaceae bacterium]|nr:hypothetical protein [Pyrinomonadaceae bacterium]
MKNKKSLCMVCLCFLLLVMGCNTYRDFVIVNMSNEIIEVEYDVLWIKVGDSSPNIMSIEEFNSEKSEWKSPNQSENSYIIDEKNNKIKVRIMPNQVFRIMTVDIDKLKRYDDEKFRIKSLKITGKQGEVTLSGNQVFNNFQQEVRNWSLIDENAPTFIYYYKEQ